MITQEHKDQIRNMAEAEYPSFIPIEQYAGYIIGAEAVLERLDIDIDAVFDIVEQHKWQQSITRGQAKQQILNAITLKQ